VVVDLRRSGDSQATITLDERLMLSNRCLASTSSADASRLCARSQFGRGLCGCLDGAEPYGLRCKVPCPTLAVCTSPQRPLRLQWSDRQTRSRKSKVPVFSSHGCWQPCFSIVWGLTVLTPPMCSAHGDGDDFTSLQTLQRAACTPRSMPDGSWMTVWVLALG
jgi:hypothetical protein